jgi:tape measure domain-containing protein
MDFLATWRVIDLITAPARRIQQAASLAQSAMDRAGRAMGGSFRNAGNSVNSLREQIDTLRNTRDALRIHVDTSEIANANRQLAGLQRELDRVERRNGRADGTGGGGSGGLMGMMSRRLLPLLAVSTLAAGAKSFSGSGMQRELIQSKYQQFGGEQKGLQTFEELNKFANDTIYKNTDVLREGARIVEQFGANKALSQMKMYGNLAGGDAENLHGITRTMGQIKGVGTLQGDELNELANHGILGLQEKIASMKGVSVKAFYKMKEAGEITFMDVQRAMESMTGKGGKYFGYLDRMSATTFGRMQKLIGTIQDKFERLSMSNLPGLNDMLDWANKFIDNFTPAGESIMEFVKSFNPLLVAVKRILVVLGILPKTGDGVISTINMIDTVFFKLAGVVRFVGDVFNNLITGIQMLPFGDVIIKVLAVWAATQKFGGITGILNSFKTAWLSLNAGFLATPIGWVVIGIVALVAALTYAWQNSEKFREVVVRSWEGIKAVWASISETFISVWDSVVFWWTKISQFIEGSWLMTKDYVVKKFYEMYEPVKPYVDAIVRAFNYVKETVGDIWDKIGDKIQSVFEKVVNFLKPFAEAFKKVLPTTLGLGAGFGVVGGLYDKFQTGYNSKAADKAAKIAKVKPKGFFDSVAGGMGGMGDGAGGAGGAGGSGKGGSGISDTVEGAKSRTINITIKNMIETINNNVSSEAVGKKVSDDVLDTLNRLFSSADRLAFE